MGMLRTRQFRTRRRFTCSSGTAPTDLFAPSTRSTTLPRRCRCPSTTWARHKCIINHLGDEMCVPALCRSSSRRMVVVDQLLYLCLTALFNSSITPNRNAKSISTDILSLQCLLSEGSLHKGNYCRFVIFLIFFLFVRIAWPLALRRPILCRTPTPTSSGA